MHAMILPYHIHQLNVGMLYSPFAFFTYFAMMLGFMMLATMSSGSYTLPVLSM